MVAGGVSFHGPGKLILIAGNQDSNAYEGMLKYYKEDIDFLKLKSGNHIYFQQDNASNHISSKSMENIKKLFYIAPEPTEEEKNLKPPALIPKKTKQMSKEEYESLKKLYLKMKVEFTDKKHELEQNRLNSPMNSNQDLLLKWSSNSPANYFLT